MNYVVMRQEEGAKPATINREVDGLQRAFSLAIDKQMLAYAPKFPNLPEHNAREGFFDRGDFEALLGSLTVRGGSGCQPARFLSVVLLDGHAPWGNQSPHVGRV